MCAHNRSGEQRWYRFLCIRSEREEKKKSSLFFLRHRRFFYSRSLLCHSWEHMSMSITRRVLFIVRKYSSLSLILLVFWLLIYASRKHIENVTLKSLSSRSNLTTNNDILLVIRTSKNTQALRMPNILRTWFQFSPQTTYITTNGNKSFFHRFLVEDYHHQIHSTECKQAHTIRDLCCHSASEFDIFFQNRKKYKWLCRFDDDQYVNVPLLINYLRQFRPEKELLYIGKPSMNEPKQGRGVRFWFATYGGGVCFSKALLQKIRDDIQPDEVFMEGCVASNYPMIHISHISFERNIT